MLSVNPTKRCQEELRLIVKAVYRFPGQRTLKCIDSFLAVTQSTLRARSFLFFIFKLVCREIRFILKALNIITSSAVFAL